MIGSVLTYLGDSFRPIGNWNWIEIMAISTWSAHSCVPDSDLLSGYSKSCSVHLGTAKSSTSECFDYILGGGGGYLLVSEGKSRDNLAGMYTLLYLM